METLPAEMLDMIVRQLTPQDLAHCSAVSRAWRQVFNQDWMWEMHCDAELEETLRTTPCVAEPAFVSPEEENSTLPPICFWKLAYMREHHLWGNWAREDNVNVRKLEIEDLRGLDFLTDTLVVVWCSNRIEIWDILVEPAVCKATSDNTVSIGSYETCSVIGANLLLVEKEYSIEVYDFDLTNKLINLKHSIFLFPNGVPHLRVFKDHFCFAGNERVLKIFDLNTGSMVNEESYPVMASEYHDFVLWNIRSSSTGDLVAVTFRVELSFYTICFYNVKQLAFLPVVTFDFQLEPFSNIDVAILGNWLAYRVCNKWGIYNIQTGDITTHYDDVCTCYELQVCGDCFVFLEEYAIDETSRVRSYSPLLKTSTEICVSKYITTNTLVNDKIVVIRERNILRFWTLSGKLLKKYDGRGYTFVKVNRSFTIMLMNCLLHQDTLLIRYLW